MTIKLLGYSSSKCDLNLYDNKGNKLAEVVIHNPVTDTDLVKLLWDYVGRHFKIFDKEVIK